MATGQSPQAQVSWKDYEEAVYQECERVYLLKRPEIIKNAHIVGRFSETPRQIDVLIKERNGNGDILMTLVECKHYATKINVKIVDSFIGCLEDVGADKGIIVSEKGFTRAAINRAHKGKDDIEVDIMSLGELSQFQAVAAIPFAGDNALAIAAPFGWILDGKRRDFTIATMYRRGISFEEATGKEKEWLYLNFWSKDPGKDTLEKLIEAQNDSLMEIDSRADIQLSIIDGLLVRKAFLPSYPTPEITIFREFETFIAFAVLFCPDCFVTRNTKKVVSSLREAVPMHIQMEGDDNI